MGNYLMLDIGAGTMDILFYNSDYQINYKAVVCSPAREIAKKIELSIGNLLITGYEMGGNNIFKLLTAKAKKNLIVLSENAALTLHHNIEKIRSFGIKVVNDYEINIYRKTQEFDEIEFTDIQLDRIKQIVKSFGVKFEFDVIGICAQDHGNPPYGISHLEFRHRYLASMLGKNSSPSDLIYDIDNIPKNMNRLSSIAKFSLNMLAKKVYIMDSGMAAIVGTSMDIVAKSKKNIIVLDIATSHTIGAAIKSGFLVGFFEYHTSDITLDKLELLIKDLSDGNISHDKILDEGGHGAYIRGKIGYNNVDAIIVTGPKRNLIKNFNIPVVFGSPWGDNMMTGTTGLMESIRLKENMSIIDYF